MSRNIGNTDCQFCGSEVELLEPERPIEASDCGVYAVEYVGRLIVAKAWCPQCESKYLAWIHHNDGIGHTWNPKREHKFVDLSFRSTFNDEPGENDFPLWEVIYKPIRVGLWRNRA